jgi:serine/threonine protein kinase
MSHCPTPEQLEQMLEEQLADRDQNTVSLHVSTCAACQTMLENLTADTERGDGARTLVLHPQQTASAAKEPLTPFLARLKELPPRAVAAASGQDGRSHTGASWHHRGADGPVNGFPTLPGYDIVAELGRGGMGVVYKARQTGLNRIVALKMILAGPHARPKDLARFRQEAEAVARLHHPNIVQIHDIGEADGVPYLVLEYVEEGNLVQRLRGDPQELKPAVRLIETLARTVHFAHQRGVVHRDLKPANILLQRTDTDAAGSGDSETVPPARGTFAAGVSAAPSTGLPITLSPKITDFGLAKRLDEHDQGTPSGEIVGTPSYMAPEQAGSKPELIGPATDVYALGAILVLLSRERRHWIRWFRSCTKSRYGPVACGRACPWTWKPSVSNA